jgi:serine/threonine protein kinase
MEYLRDGDLRRLVLDGRIVADDMAAIVADIADALDYAHGHGMVHRDVKPANILFDHAGRAKLTDFDLVRAADTTGGTRTGALGTFGYVAPEALDQAREAGPAADIYSLGMTAAFILNGTDLPGIVHRAPEQFIKHLPCEEAIKQILLHAVDPELEHRLASMREFASLLRWWRYGILTREEIETLIITATETHLVTYRSALMADIAPTFVAALPRRNVPLEQLRSDLHRLNRTPTWIDGTVPLRQWLGNAASLTHSGRGSEIFKRARIDLDKAVIDRMNGLGPIVTMTTRSTGGVASLSLSDVDEIVRSAIAASISGPEYRSALMNGLPEQVVSQLPIVDTPLDQIRLDLEALNALPPFAGFNALHVWLSNASWLCRPQLESDVFARIAARVAGEHAPITENATGALLGRAEVQALIEMMIASRMVESAKRDLLLSGLSPQLRYSLPDAPSPLLQMESDLRILNQFPSKARPDEVPLVTWLLNAAMLAHDDLPMVEELKRLADQIVTRVNEREKNPSNG